MEQRVRDLSERLAKKGHQVEVFTSDIDCPKDKQIKSSINLKIHYLKSIKIANNPTNLSLMFKIKKEEGNIFHLHLIDSFYSTVSYFIFKIKKLPYIAHIRGDIQPSGRMGFLLPAYKKIFLKRILKNSSKIIALNRDYKKMFSKLYDLDPYNIVVIPNSTDFSILSDESLKIRKELKNILFVGRLTDEKNVEVLIHSLILLKNKGVVLHFAGEGEDKLKLEELVKKLELEEKVIFLGKLDRKKLYKEYLKSDLVILPSKVECFSSVLLEAMATGVPIIASDIPGTRSVIKNGYNGLLVKPTPEKIAEAIEKLKASHKLREKLARNGLKEVKKYSWDKIVEQTEKVYEEVLREHNKKLKKKRSK
ncbi:MAG TPA: glycosyltransferase family 4 protein [Caldisericia bacterium]|nr:glycosyltransferase family 4 protein [Caldisericia bacterium]